MDWLTALILGIVQGLAEFLPISSSGHLELGKVILNSDLSENITFTVVVHGATVLSTVVVFYKDILQLTKALFSFRWDDQTRYIAKLLLSMAPVAFIGIFFKEEAESFFNGNVLFVGSMLILTAILLFIAHFRRPGNKNITFLDAIIIGIAQAIAVLPGLSRSGVTISTGLLLGNKRELVTRFSFLMVILPVLGANFMDILRGDMGTQVHGNIGPIIIGFISAFICGLLACRWMIGIVRKGKLIWFAIYCLVIGTIAVFISL
ncbi:MAG: undecaprenyl-diphosphate phosphatase [Bacteroidetes bacterium]|nr:undecaprenyl-diphosphate phosphatase [Bacteroidota bacterium]